MEANGLLKGAHEARETLGAMNTGVRRCDGGRAPNKQQGHGEDRLHCYITDTGDGRTQLTPLPAALYNPDAMFDAHGAVTFDLTRGLVQLRGQTPQVLIPADVLTVACEEGAADQMGSRLGKMLAGRVRCRLGDTAGQPHDEVIEQLAGEIALTGLGALRLERWGRSVVFVLEACPLGKWSEVVIETLLGAALVELGQRELAVVALGTSAQESRFAVLAPTVATELRRRLEVGESWQALLAALQQEGARGEV